MSDFKSQSGQSLMGGYSEAEKQGTRDMSLQQNVVQKPLSFVQLAQDNNRYAHTGSGYGYEEGVKRIPAAAISAPDAILIQNILKRKKTVIMKNEYDIRNNWTKKRANIIGEITGSEHPDQYLVLGAHIDSWDEGTGSSR